MTPLASKSKPFFPGVRPYQQVPFQFSLRIIDAAGAEPHHRMFLADGRGDHDFLHGGSTDSPLIHSNVILTFRAREWTEPWAWIRIQER